MDIEALAEHGNINLTASDTQFSNIRLHHGINYPGDIGINVMNSVVYEDLTCQVSWLRARKFMISNEHYNRYSANKSSARASKPDTSSIP